MYIYEWLGIQCAASCKGCEYQRSGNGWFGQLSLSVTHRLVYNMQSHVMSPMAPSILPTLCPGRIQAKGSEGKGAASQLWSIAQRQPQEQRSCREASTWSQAPGAPSGSAIVLQQAGPFTEPTCR